MSDNKDHNNLIKMALERRSGSNALPSNFNYNMMKQIRIQAEKKKKRYKRISFLSLIAACCLLFFLGGYAIVGYLEFNLMNYIPKIEITRFSPDVVGFYAYIAFLVLLLLGLDYWLRQHRRKSDRQ